MMSVCSQVMSVCSQVMSVCSQVMSVCSQVMSVCSQVMSATRTSHFDCLTPWIREFCHVHSVAYIHEFCHLNQWEWVLLCTHTLWYYLNKSSVWHIRMRHTHELLMSHKSMMSHSGMSHVTHISDFAHGRPTSGWRRWSGCGCSGRSRGGGAC